MYLHRCEIYNFPVNEFVASFVGQINLLPVKIENFKEKRVRIGKQIIQAGRIGESTGEHPRLAIRPEEVRPGHEQGDNNLCGRVAEVTYLGSVLRCKLELENVLISMDIFNERVLQIPAVGSQFDFHFPKEACWVLW